MKNKGALSLILVFCFILGVAQIGFYKLAAEDTVKTVYVSKSGTDSKRNGTNAKPYKTVAYAITNAKSSNPDIIVINVKDYAEFDFETEFGGNLVIQGSADDAQLQVVSGKTLESQSTKTCVLNSNLTFNSINILSALDEQGFPLEYLLITQGKTLTFGEGTCFDQNTVKVLAGRANEVGTQTFDQEITVEDAKFSGEVNPSSGLDIAVGVLPAKDTADCVNPLGKIDININSGDVKRVSFLNTNTVYSEDVTITWLADLKSQDQEAVGFEGENNSTFNKSLQIIMNNCAVSANIGEGIRSANADGGKWIMLVNNDYSYLEATDVPGKFKVCGELEVKAVDTQNESNIYYSAKSGEDEASYLDLSDKPGEYNVSAEIPSEYFETLYVSASGNDNTGNGTQLRPYATIAKAEEVIAASGIETGEIILLTDMTLTTAPHTKMITISGNTGSENIIQTSSTVESVNGPTTFSNLSVNDTFSHASNGNEVVYDNVKISGSRGIFYFGNIEDGITGDNNITVSGLGTSTWNGANVRIGPKNRGSAVDGNINVVVNSGYFNQFWVFEGVYNGNVTFTLNGGTVYGSDPFLDPYLDYTTTYNGAYQLILNNGFSPSKVSETVKEINAARGSWFVYSDKSGGMISATNTPGTFAVEGGKTAVAKERTSKITYYSYNKELTLPTGVYDVTYTDENPSNNLIVISHKGSNSSSFTQKVSLEKGKTYNVSFDYIDGYEQLDKSIVLAVFDNQNNKVCSSNNSGISLISEDENKYHRTYSFVHNGDSGEYYIGFGITGDYAFAISDFVCSADKTGVNLVKNGNFKNHLNNWVVDGYSPDGEDIYKNGIEMFVAVGHIKADDYFEKVVYDPGEELGTPKMLYIENYSGYRTILQRFYKIIKPDTKYAFECSISSQIDYKLNVRKTGSREAIYKLDPEKTVEIEKETELGTVYYKQAYYEFMIPGTVDNQIFIGFEFASGQTAIIFDLKLYEVDDPEKKNILVNPDFEEGLDEWIWGWTIWYNHDADSSGLLEWQGDNGKLILKKYDYKNLVTYFDDRYYIDGTWWDSKDVESAVLGTGEVRGIIKDSDGKAMSNVAVLLISDDYELRGKTNASGTFEFTSVPVGEYTLFSLDSFGGEYYITNLLVIKDGKYQLNVVCDISGLVLDVTDNSDTFDDYPVVPLGAIKGTVYTPDKKTVAGLKLYLSTGASVLTDDNGDFEFAALPGGEYRIGTELNNGKIYVLKAVTLEDNTIATIKLKYDLPKSQSSISDDGVPLWIWLVVAGSGLLVLAAGALISVLIFIRKRKTIKG